MRNQGSRGPKALQQLDGSDTAAPVKTHTSSFRFLWICGPSVDQAAARTALALSTRTGERAPSRSSASCTACICIRLSAFRPPAALTVSVSCVFRRLFCALRGSSRLRGVRERPIGRRGTHEPAERKGLRLSPYSPFGLPPQGSPAGVTRLKSDKERRGRRQRALIGEFLVGHLRSPSSECPHGTAEAVRIPELAELAACQTL